MSISARYSPEDLQRIQKELKSSATRTFDYRQAATVKGKVHEKQLAFATDSSRNIITVAPRRGGKSTGIAIRAAGLSVTKTKATTYYLSKSEDYAERTFLRNGLHPLLHKMGIPYRTSDGVDTWFDNGSVIYCRGIGTKDSIENLRGEQPDLVIIDECGIVDENILETLLKAVLSASMRDRLGTVIMAGTPSPVLSGTYYEAWAGKFAEEWKHHFFDMFDNPTFTKKGNEEFLADQIRLYYGTALDPTYRREYLGEWVTDSNLTCYKYLSGAEDGLPSCHVEKEQLDARLSDRTMWRFVCGVDFGSRDRDAIVVLGQNYHDRCYYLVEEHVTKRGQNAALSWMAEKLALVGRRYPKIQGFFDTGGGGLKAYTSLVQDYGFGWVTNAFPARKRDLRGDIDQVNTFLRSGRLKIPRDSKTAEDMMKTLWDPEALKRGVWKFASGWHPDPSEALRYALNGIYERWYEPEDDRTQDQKDQDEMRELMAARTRRRRGVLGPAPITLNKPGRLGTGFGDLKPAFTPYERGTKHVPRFKRPGVN